MDLGRIAARIAQGPVILEGPFTEVDDQEYYFGGGGIRLEHDASGLNIESPTLQQLMEKSLGPDDAGAAFGQGKHEILFEIQDWEHRPSQFRGSREQPADPSEFEITKYDVVGIDGTLLENPRDREALKSVVPLPEELEDRAWEVVQKELEKRGEPI